MKRLAISFCLFLLSFNFIYAQGTAACGSVIYDSGGINGNYGNNEIITTTVFPDNPGEKVRFVFSYFETEDTFDTLTVYNGDTTAAAVLGTFSGNVISTSITSTHPTGALTFVFESDSTINYGGYEILVSCLQISEGQYVSVDQSTYNVDQLVEDILINSSCAEISNIIYSTGTNYGSSNGIGYFSGNNSTFPFAEGLILSTGDALLAEGPEQFVQNDFSNPSEVPWPGDQDLINAVPNHVDSNDATFIQFDFTPRASAISFNFIFASEEYGEYQCDFTDAFAFLLTNNQTGQTTNLALVPGSTDPISVFSVRDRLFNPSCASANEEFFASYYGLGGLDPMDSPINFIGHTVSMEAQSEVIPNSSYSIKLVIADSQDSYFNAAVFLEAGSFDLGGNLGEDITIQAGTALCDGGTITLDSQSPEANHIWYYNGVEITSESSSTIDVTQEGTYSVDIIYGADCSASDSILIEYKPLPQIYNSIDLVNCDSVTTGFDLTENDTLILGSQNPNEFNISYHLSIQDAENDLNPIINNVTNFFTSNPNTIIYIRIEDAITETCFVTESFNLIKSATAVPIGDTQQTFCDVETIADLAATGDNIQWYDAAAGGNLLDSSTTLIDGQLVYASQTVDDCESTDRLAVTVSIQDIEITASATENCAGESVDLSVTFSESQDTSNSPYFPTDGLIGFYDLNGNIDDQSAEQNNGSTDGSFVQDRNGNENSAVSLNNQMIIIPGLDALNTNNFTIQFWTKANSYNIHNKVQFGEYGSNFQWRWALNWSNSSLWNDSSIYYYPAGSPSCTGYASSYNGTNNDTIDLDIWHFMTFVVDGQSTSFYVNGQLVETSNNAPLLSCFTENMNVYFGGDVGGGGVEYYNGYFDDIGLWSRSLTQAEILGAYNQNTTLWSTGETTETITVTPSETTDYWVDVTNNGVTCREYITINVTAPVAPTGDAEQLFCDAATVSDLTATGDNIQWYDAATGGNLLDPSAALTDGQLVYASQTVNDCESNERLIVTVSIQNIQITASATEVCAGESVDLGVSSTGSLTTASCPVLPSNLQNGLVGYWPFCGNANDESGNGNNGTVNGATLTTDRFGNADSAYSFDGDDWIDIGSTSLYNITGGLTISLFYKSSSANSTSQLLLSHPNNEQHRIQLLNNDIKFEVDNGIWNSVSLEMNIDEWTLVTAVFDEIDSKIKIYENGVFNNEIILSSTNFTSDPEHSRTLLGGYFTGGIGNLIETFSGQIDDVIIWDRALSASDIQQFVNNSTYTWSTGETTETITVTSPETTEYWVDVTTNGVTCREYITVSIQDIQITASATEVCAGESVDLTISSGLTTGLAVCTSSDLPTNLQTGLVGYWPFCGNANDESGNGNDGLVNGAILTSDRFGEDDNAYIFDGINDWISLNGPIQDMANFTISAWVYHTGESYSGIFSDANGVPAEDVFFNMSPNEVGVHADKQSTNLKSLVIPGPLSGPSAFVTSQDLNGQWQNILWVLSPTESKIYINGINVAIIDATGSNIGNHDSNPSIGRLTDNFTSEFYPTQYFNGKLDDFIIWSRALSESEIQQLNNFSTYTWSSGETTANITVTPIETTEYWVDVTTNGVTCREYITINVTAPAAPTGNAEQLFCDAATVAGLTATGDNIQWYDAASGGNLLDSTTVLTDGLMVYASQTVDGCESADRLTVTVSIQDNQIIASATEVCPGESVDLSISTIDVEYFNWDDNEPNDTLGIENVVHIQPSGKWNDNGSESYFTNAIFELNYEVSELGNLIFLGNYNSHSYFYANQSLTWLEANQVAESYNTYLLNINTAEENEFIVNSVNNLGLVLDAWLGMIQDENDELYSEPSGGWKWLNSNYLNPEDYSYIWSTGDTTENITVNPTETTEYWVDVTTNGLTCREYITVVIQDTDPPLVDLASLPQLTAQCELTALTPPTATDNCDGTITGVTTATLPITASTTITWTYTDSTGNSSTQTQDVVIQNIDPPILNAEVSSEPFADTHVIEAAASGIGVYEFSLDNGPWQSSGTFIGVSPGEHIVSVRDVNCFSEDSYPLMVLDYPPFFTPNGDGYNDFWNIEIFSGQPTSKIYIFDRYGKLLKQIRPSGPGWNGTYNGKRMPTSDYWFLLEYSDFTSGDPKILRGHFTLKR